uniref:Egg protein CP391S n=1 Tax=Schistosoma japonicum TaxID=6182 RepID=C1LEN9_SCHJA|nr:hypothetical protein [Schistosoma japonicum]
MLAAMSFHLNQMNSLLYWLIPSMIYFNILYLDNSVALEEYYSYSESSKRLATGLEKTPYTTRDSRLIIKQLGFTVKVHQFELKSAIVFKNESTVYMADTFEQGNPMRSFRIVDADSDQNELRINSYAYSLQVVWNRLQYCKLHPGTYANVSMSVSRKGIVTIGINAVNKPDKNCDMTFEIADEKYEGSKDGSGNIVGKKVIFKKVIPGSNISNSRYFLFTPQTTCQEHTSEVACTNKTRGELNCDWCGKCQTCVLKESPCSCLDRTETTESQPQKIESSINYHIVLGFALIVLFIFGMIACT